MIGVDDYGLCENFPILNSTDGYTLLAIREILSFKNLSTILGNGTNYTNSGFLFEYYSTNGEIKTISFGSITNALNDVTNVKKSFVYQTKNKYNGKTINVGSNESSISTNTLFAATAGAPKANIALYALKIYNRDLTDEEIEKEKAKMIKRYEEKTGEKYTEV